MSKRELLHFWNMAVICCLLSAATVVAQPVAAPKASDGSYRIGSGDVLLIEVAGEPDLKRKAKVDEQGAIRLPYIDHDLKLGGLTERQAVELLNQEFRAILKEPQVTVFIEEYNALAAAVTGAINKTQRIPLTRELRVFDLISLGGGLNDKAGNIVQLIHTKGGESVEVIDLRELVRRPELNRVIRDGDVLNVPEAGVFYVTGNVQKPGPFPLKEQVKLTQALAYAGYLAPDSKRREIKLLRANGPDQSATVEQTINLDELEKNPNKDIVLRPYDVVYVPENTRTKQTRSLISAFAGGLASALGWGILR